MLKKALQNILEYTYMIQSAIRTNLSLHKCFRRCEDIMGSYWTVDDDEFVLGRHLKRGRPRKYDKKNKNKQNFQ